jgi:gluconolactonase
MFDPPALIATTVFASVPDPLRKTGPRPAWFDERPFASTHSFLEGPAFDRVGNLYCVDMPYGRIFRITPAGAFSVVAEYDGHPNGLRIHRDGRIFVADRSRGVMVIDPERGTASVLVEKPERGHFLGLNDLMFARNGDLYFTDQGSAGLENPVGAVYCLRQNGDLDLVLGGIPGPNGLALNATDTVLYLNVSRTNAIWTIPLSPKGPPKRVSVFIQLSGSTAGPDGLAVDEDGGLAVAHSGLGTVWIFSPEGEPRYRIKSCTGLHTTNIAYGGADRRTLFITESHTGTILQALVQTPGRMLYSHD